MIADYSMRPANLDRNPVVASSTVNVEDKPGPGITWAEDKSGSLSALNGI
jgi:hypothetical protein